MPDPADDKDKREPVDLGKLERSVLTGRSKTFRERLFEAGPRRRQDQPQAFYTAEDDRRDLDNPDVIDRRGDVALPGGYTLHGPILPLPEGKTIDWPPQEWKEPAGEGWDERDLPTGSQLANRAAHAYETPLPAADRDAYQQWRESHRNADASEVDPDRPSIDWAGYWQATQRPGASGPESNLPLSHWETPYSPTFSSNRTGKYALPTPGGLAGGIEQFTNPYRTTLAPAEEKEFRQWASVSKAPYTDDPKADYDMRGFWKGLRAGDPRATTAVNPVDGQTHYPDTWKTPHHQSFSDESIYAQPGAPSWHGDVLVGPGGRIVSDERKLVPVTPAGAPIRPVAGDVSRLPPPTEEGDK